MAAAAAADAATVPDAGQGEQRYVYTQDVMAGVTVEDDKLLYASDGTEVHDRVRLFLGDQLSAFSVLQPAPSTHLIVSACTGGNDKDYPPPAILTVVAKLGGVGITTASHTATHKTYTRQRQSRAMAILGRMLKDTMTAYNEATPYTDDYAAWLGGLVSKAMAKSQGFMRTLIAEKHCDVFAFCSMSLNEIGYCVTAEVVRLCLEFTKEVSGGSLNLMPLFSTIAACLFVARSPLLLHANQPKCCGACKSPKVKLCAGCKTYWFCNSACARAQWKEHRETCRELRCGHQLKEALDLSRRQGLVAMALDPIFDPAIYPVSKIATALLYVISYSTDALMSRSFPSTEYKAMEGHLKIARHEARELMEKTDALQEKLFEFADIMVQTLSRYKRAHQSRKAPAQTVAKYDAAIENLQTKMDRVRDSPDLVYCHALCVELGEMFLSGLMQNPNKHDAPCPCCIHKKKYPYTH